MIIIHKRKTVPVKECGDGGCCVTGDMVPGMGNAEIGGPDKFDYPFGYLKPKKYKRKRR